MEFSNKTVLINGGGSGIGLLSAQRFAAAGAHVIIADIDITAAEEAAVKLGAAGGTIAAVAVDNRKYNEVKQAVQRALQCTGRLDILLNCAGGSAGRVFGKSEHFKDLDIEIIDWGIDVNLRGSVYYCHAAIGFMMEKQNGTIIHMGSVEGITGTRAVEYGAAKSGIIGLTKSLAIYGAPYGVRVCCISPGPVLTRKAMAKMPTLLGRAAEPDEIVDLIEYLCSNKAAFITGTNYLIDGGRSCGVISYSGYGE